MGGRDGIGAERVDGRLGNRTGVKETEGEATRRKGVARSGGEITEDRMGIERGEGAGG